MKTADRRSQLLEAATVRGYVRVVDLADEFGVSEMTIRRDLDTLADEGALRRVRGGAMSHPTSAVRLDPEAPAAQRVGPVGLIVPAVGDYHSGPAPYIGYFFQQVLEAAQDTLSQHGLHGRLARTSSRAPGAHDVLDDQVRGEEQAAVRRLLDDEGASGLLFTPNTHVAEDSYRAWLEDLGVPIVLIERSVGAAVNGARISSVRTLHRHGVRLAVHHVRSRGHRRVGFLGYHLSQTATELHRSWAHVTTQFELESSPQWSVTDYDGWPEPQIIDTWLDEVVESGITALLIHNDNNAHDVVTRLRARRLSVPEDLSIISYDDDIAGMLTPPITAIAPPKRRVGQVAASLLIDQIHDHTAQSADILIHPTLVPRRSVMRLDR